MRDRGATVALLSLLACHKPTGLADDGDDAGDDGSCGCSMMDGTSALDFSCGTTVCIGGTSYLCSEGDPIPEGDCVPAESTGDDGGSLGDDGSAGNCVAMCDGVSCGGPDMCGGVCGCEPGVSCSSAGMCGNGCALLAGEPCSDAGFGDPNTCCEEGNLCRFITDSGVGTCCAQTTTKTLTGGLCNSDTDCCDYPMAICQLDAGATCR